MELNLLVFIIGLPVVGAANLLWFTHELRVFVDTVPCLETERDLDRFKQLAARQMIAALFQIAIMVMPVVTYVYGLVTHQLTMGEIVYLIVPNCGLAALGVWAKGTERRAKQVPAADPALAEARDQVVSTWMRKALPDW